MRLSPINEFKKSSDVINGLSEYELIFWEDGEKSLKDDFLVVRQESDKLRLCLKCGFLPGSIIVVKLVY